MSRGATHEPKLIKVPVPVPCPRCYAPARKTPDGYACDRHGPLTERDNRTDREVSSRSRLSEETQNESVTETTGSPDFCPARSVSDDPGTAAWLAEWDRRRTERLARRTARAKQRPGYWTRPRVIAAIQAFHAEHGEPPTSNELKALAVWCMRDGWAWADAVEAAGFTRPTRGKRARREQVPA